MILKVDPKIRYQRLEGWGGTLWGPGIPFEEWIKSPTRENYMALPIKDSVPDEIKFKLMDDAVFHLGLNRFRLEIGPQVVAGNRPESDSPGFRFKWQDFIIKKWLLPLKERIERRGDPMILYISYDLRSRLTPAWLLRPKEYAEMAVATLGYLKTKYHLEPNYWSVLNEPGNQRPGTPELVAELIARTGKRVKESGFLTRMSGPEVVTPKQITPYMKALQATPGALQQMGQLTYHLYWDPKNIPQRNEIRTWAQKLGITTAQTEWMEGKGLNVMEALHLDLTEANASAWEQYGICSVSDSHESDGGGAYFLLGSDFTSYVMNPNSWYLRQIMNYVRPGDVRIRIDSSSQKVRPLAFRSADGRTTAVLINSHSRPLSVLIQGLPPRSYDFIVTDATRKGYRFPPKETAGGQDLIFDMPSKSIITVWGR